MAEAGRCERCGRRFNGRAKPHWVFDVEAKPRGLMHAGCAAQANPRHPGTDAAIATEKEAQFIAWTDLADRDADTPRELAIVMSWAVHPSLEPGHLSENQEQWLARIGDADRRAAIQAAYDELLGEFREWDRARG